MIIILSEFMVTLHMSVPFPAIKTGHIDCHARFCSMRSQLSMVKEGNETIVELGFSGSRLLERLMRQAGQVNSREELMSYAWPDRVVSPGSLNQQIYTLRQILGDEKNRQIIQTVHRRGYLLNPEYLIPPPPDESETAVAEEPQIFGKIPNSQDQSPPRTKRMLMLGITILSLLSPSLYFFATGQLNTNQQPASTTVVLTDRHQTKLQQLIDYTHDLAQRVVALSGKPVELVMIAIKPGLYEIRCTQPGGQTHSLTLQTDDLSSVSDPQLQACQG